MAVGFVGINFGVGGELFTVPKKMILKVYPQC